MTPENGKNDTKYDETIQNNRLPVGFSDFVPRDCFVSIVMYISVLIFIHVRKT